MTCPANWTILLLYCPVPDALAMEDMPALQDNRLLPSKLHHAHRTARLLALHRERFVVLLDPPLLRSSRLARLCRLLAYIDLVVSLIGVDIGHLWISGRISTFLHAAQADAEGERKCYKKYCQVLVSIYITVQLDDFIVFACLFIDTVVSVVLLAAVRVVIVGISITKLVTIRAELDVCDLAWNLL